MSLELRRRIEDALRAITLIDPHSHIDPLAPASRNLADLLGYHYYTELAHSAGTPRQKIEDRSLSPRDKVGVLVESLHKLDNTIQYSWLIEICQKFFGFTDDRLTPDNWEALYDSAEKKMRGAQWADQVLADSNVAGVFLTNDFDDPLAGFDTSVYIPCLRTDDLVFHYGKVDVRQRLGSATNVDVKSIATLRAALRQRFDHFISKGARACAISLPPDFSPHPISDGRAETALADVLRLGTDAHDHQRTALSQFVFWTLAELCREYGLPFDLMIGVNRNVYPEGVHQGRDLFDSRVSLLQYRDLFNAFPEVTFPISVLASVTNQELTSYAWIFPNVVTNGHWWYSNTPSFIERDLAARLEAVPHTEQIGYYSDAYKLEFIAPKFEMYRRCLAKVLANTFVIDRGWSEERAVELGERVLRTNVERIFPEPQARSAAMPYVPPADAISMDELEDENLPISEVAESLDDVRTDDKRNMLGLAAGGLATASGLSLHVGDDEADGEEAEFASEGDEVEVADEAADAEFVVSEDDESVETIGFVDEAPEELEQLDDEFIVDSELEAAPEIATESESELESEPDPSEFGTEDLTSELTREDLFPEEEEFADPSHPRPIAEEVFPAGDPFATEEMQLDELDDQAIAEASAELSDDSEPAPLAIFDEEDEVDESDDGTTAALTWEPTQEAPDSTTDTPQEYILEEGLEVEEGSVVELDETSGDLSGTVDWEPMPESQHEASNDLGELKFMDDEPAPPKFGFIEDQVEDQEEELPELMELAELAPEHDESETEELHIAESDPLTSTIDWQPENDSEKLSEAGFESSEDSSIDLLHDPVTEPASSRPVWPSDDSAEDDSAPLLAFEDDNEAELEIADPDSSPNILGEQSDSQLPELELEESGSDELETQFELTDEDKDSVPELDASPLTLDEPLEFADEVMDFAEDSSKAVSDAEAGSEESLPATEAAAADETIELDGFEFSFSDEDETESEGEDKPQA